MHERRGLTVMLTSHDLGDIEHLCPRMIMIDRGRIVYDGPFAEVTRRFGYERQLHLTLSTPIVDTEAALAPVIGGREIRITNEDGQQLSVTFDGREFTSGELIRDLATALPIADIRLEEPTAESIIRKLYQGELRFEEASAERER
jgi:viologen exporter family transport system ATP-binding protein